MKKLLTLFMAFVPTFSFAAVALSGVTPAQQQDPSYLLNHLDDPTLKGYLGSTLLDTGDIIGVMDFTGNPAAYGNGVPGAYPLLDAISGSQLTLPVGSIVKRVLVYPAVTLAVSGAPTVSVGYSGSTASLVGVSTASAFISGSVYAGVPANTTATMVLNGVTATPLTATIAGATVNTGRAYVIMSVSRGLQ